ncbi:30S ribosomal protein S4 [Rickettsiales endosymbiont of Stachyamoeba lipophora]|uniref:30S ribosomal protein S4 n=1 Tax=Rickettsiales endosymbiont of Stachyamoeba lipophora TaxID=2486578 RepID=UPI000F652CF8|nr:30S ribosomal protein S4 [Rickettsiales endosymbiont of Stachyamoeba lipophora]AZL15065.1 30S ribosomal protein S4 [Rickettsiales endosymbiont of Stachyamoeba lipophora]
MTKLRKLKKTKLCRSYGVNLWGKANSGFITRNYRPGQHGKNTQRRLSDFGTQLIAKQRIKYYYGIKVERQLRRIYKEAMRLKGNSSQNLIGLLESRLATVVYRLNFVNSIFAANQIISHGHILVNGHKLDVSSYQVKPGDIIEVAPGYRENVHFIDALSKMENDVPDYMELDAKAFKGTFIKVPELAEVPFPFEAEPHLVIEFYSR